MSVIAMLISSYAVRLAVSLHNAISHDSNNNNGNSRNVDGIASEFGWRYNNVSEESPYDFFLDPFMHTLIQAGVSCIMYIAISFLLFSEFVGLSDKKMQSPKIITSVAPYVTIANALQAIGLAHEDGFSGIELDEDHLHCLVQVKPSCLNLIHEYSTDKHMINFLHKTLFRPSIDSENQAERRQAVDFTLKTLDYMEAAGISRMILHSFSDLPGFFKSRSESANKVGYFLGCYVVQVYGILAPPLKEYRKARKDKVERSFMNSLSEIAKYASDKKIDGRPIEIVFEEHYSDAIDYDSISYGKGNFINVIRGIDTAHQLIRTGKNTDLSEMSEPIHFHAVDTNGIIDDHRTIGRGKVNFKDSLSDTIKRKLTNTIVIENRTRSSALESKEVLASMIKKM